jgi:CheY-like chemotaxis protein
MNSRTILIIEDNPSNMELAKDLLENSGYTVVSANESESGLRLARQLNPDLILMDWSLPGMDGLAATRQLKRDPATRHIPVVILTAHAMQGDGRLARQSGCDGYLTKPIATRTFVETLNAWLIPPNFTSSCKSHNSAL